LREFANRLQGLAEAGVGLFQIRDKSLESLDLLRYTVAAVEAVGAERVIVNDRVDIALAGGAGGVHVGQEDLPIQAVRQLAGHRLWIGVSTHDIQQARRAEADGADYIGCGPTFPSATKQFTAFAGIEFLQEVAQEIDLPAYAIGGITAGNIALVQAAGVGRIAVSGAIWSAEEPIVQAAGLAELLGGRSRSSAAC
jgi:thiamine-phosphate pyrophosphorylase